MCSERTIFLNEVEHFAMNAYALALKKGSTLDPDSFNLPVNAQASKAEMEMAKALITRMTAKWEPTKYKDDYRSSLLGLIEQKVESGGQELKTPKGKAKAPTNVIDLVEVLKQSMAETTKSANRTSKGPRLVKTKRKKAA